MLQCMQQCGHGHHWHLVAFGCSENISCGAAVVVFGVPKQFAIKHEVRWFGAVDADDFKHVLCLIPCYV